MFYFQVKEPQNSVVYVQDTQPGRHCYYPQRYCSPYSHHTEDIPSTPLTTLLPLSETVNHYYNERKAILYQLTLPYINTLCLSCAYPY